MNERQKKAFDFVSDYTKQLIALATGIITFMVTLLQDEVKASSDWLKSILVFSWILFIISILFGIMRLMALTGNLDPVKTGASPALTITTKNVKNTGKVQMVTFMLGLLFSIVFGGFELFYPSKKEAKNKNIIIIRQSVCSSEKILKADTLYPVKKK